MHIFWQPSTRRPAVFSKGERRMYRLWKARRFYHREIHTITHYLLMIAFLLFAVRFGSAIFCFFFRPSDTMVTMSNWGIELPKSITEQTIWSKRHAVMISVRPDSVIKFDGKVIEEADLYGLMLERYREDPQTLAWLFIDKSRPMGSVFRILDTLKQVRAEYATERGLPPGGGPPVLFATNATFTFY